MDKEQDCEAQADQRTPKVCRCGWTHLGAVIAVGDLGQRTCHLLADSVTQRLIQLADLACHALLLPGVVLLLQHAPESFCWVVIGAILPPVSMIILKRLQPNTSLFA